jgi:hypothetical protein
MATTKFWIRKHDRRDRHEVCGFTEDGGNHAATDIFRGYSGSASQSRMSEFIENHSDILDLGLGWCPDKGDTPYSAIGVFMTNRRQW